eukprot:scaffold1056_cov564-Prasinococcus_capsulatus_cf.AAC.2
MGSMYLGVGTTLAGLAFGTPIISNASLRRIVSTILSVCFAFFAWKVSTQAICDMMPSQAVEYLCGLCSTGVGYRHVQVEDGLPSSSDWLLRGRANGYLSTAEA